MIPHYKDTRHNDYRDVTSKEIQRGNIDGTNCTHMYVLLIIKTTAMQWKHDV